MADEKTQREIEAQTIIYTTKQLEKRSYDVPQNDTEKPTTVIPTLLHIHKIQTTKNPTASMVVLDPSRTLADIDPATLPFDIDHGDDIGCLIGKNGEVLNRHLNALKELGGKYDHMAIIDPDTLLFIHVQDNSEKIGFKRAALLDLFDRFKFVEEKKDNTLTVSVLVDASLRDFYQTVQNLINGRILIDSAATPDLPHYDRSKQYKTNTDTNFFDITTNDTVPCTGVHRTDHILSENNARWGDMVFFSAKESPEFTRYAVDSIVPSAPIRTPILHIAPFRNRREVRQALLKLNKFAPLGIQAVERTIFISSEDFSKSELDSENALMDTIKKHIQDFRKSMNDKGIEHGICLIDSVEIDTYGATLDYPSLRWYAKANNILIIIGADKTEERYTFDRENIRTNRPGTAFIENHKNHSIAKTTRTSTS